MVWLRQIIEMSLRGGDKMGTLHHYRPGEEIRGEVLVIPQGNINVNTCIFACNGTLKAAVTAIRAR